MAADENERKTLITFIGRGWKEKNNNGGTEQNSQASSRGYMRYRYSLDGSESEPVTFVSKALYDFLKPGKTVIIGTVGSTWSEVLNNFLPCDRLANHDDLRNALIAFEQQKSPAPEDVRAAMEKLSDAISQSLGIDFRCRIYDENSDENLFETIIDSIETDDLVDMDVTHGFRFTPMYAMMAVQYLTYVRNISFSHIYYGWAECQQEVKPIKDLSWILKLNSWITAFAQFSKTNDISAFSDLIADEHLKNMVAAASFNERITNVSESIRLIKMTNIESIVNSEDPITQTFGEPLKQKLAYTQDDSTAYCIFLLARQFLQTNDYLRAIIYLHESLMAYYCEKGVLKFDLRKRKMLDRKKKQDLKTQLLTVKEDLNNRLQDCENRIASMKQFLDKISECRNASSLSKTSGWMNSEENSNQAGTSGPDNVARTADLEKSILAEYEQLMSGEDQLTGKNKEKELQPDQIHDQATSIDSIENEIQKNLRNIEYAQKDCNDALNTVNKELEMINAHTLKMYKGQGFNLFDKLAKFYLNIWPETSSFFEEVNDLRNGVAHGNPKKYIVDKYYRNHDFMHGQLEELCHRIEYGIFQRAQ